MDSIAYKYFKDRKVEERRKAEAQWLLDNPNDSIRKIAREFDISKSQVHRDLQELKYLDDDLYINCKSILRRHNTHGRR